MLSVCDFCCDFVILGCDFFVISREVYEIKICELPLVVGKNGFHTSITANR